MHSKSRRAFSLIELLVVIAIIAVLAAIIMAVTGKAKASSQQSVCLSNMRQVGIAFQLYAGEHDYQLPGRVNTGQGDKWPKLLNDYLKNSKVYVAPGIEEYKGDEATLLSNDRNGTSFIMNGFNDLGAYDDPTMQIRTVNITQPVQTILLGMSKAKDNNFYMDVVEGNQENALNLKSYGEGSNYVFADGSVRFIKAADHDIKLWYVNKDYQIPQTPQTP